MRIQTNRASVILPALIRHNSTTPPKKSDPLRILFCGSDTFSCAALSALHSLHKANPQLIETIDVLVRPGKPAGRGLKRIAVGPLFHLAESLGLPIHQRDTFTGWTLPLPGRVTHPKTGVKTIFPHPSGAHVHRRYEEFNLLLAVSFGLFVPPRILQSLVYGGLNIHPSLLPDLRGPAPLQWTLLANRSHAGCTLQTLHPKEFDRGHILAQTPAPGIPIPEDCTSAQLLDVLAPEGARLLVDGLKQNLHVPPYPPPPIGRPTPFTPTPTPMPGPARLRHAPKIHKLDLRIDWGNRAWGRDHDLYPNGQWTATDLARRFRAVGARIAGLFSRGGMWTHATTVCNPDEERLIFEDIEAVQCPPSLRDAVLAIVQVKEEMAAVHRDQQQHGRKSILDMADEVRRFQLPANVSNVVWTTTDILSPSCAEETSQFRMPVLVEGGEEGEEHGASVVIPIRMPYKLVNGIARAVEEEKMSMDAIRVRSIKVAGSTSKPAPKALDPFMEKAVALQDIANIEYAMDVMAKRIE